MDLLRSSTSLIEISIIAIVLNYLLSFFWNTRSMDLIVGFVAFFFVLAVSSWFHLPVLHKIMMLIGNVTVIAILIIFQPELRVALSKLSMKPHRLRESSSSEKFLDTLAQTVYKLSEKRIGAIIALENEDSLQEYAQKAVILNATFSAELLETIFDSTTPLHDGAVILRDQTMVAAAAILPLMEDPQLNKSMGTRHRAGLGLSHTTDALVIVVSEETGKVSIAREGIMTKGIKIDRLKGILRSIFQNPLQKPPIIKPLLSWLHK